MIVILNYRFLYSDMFQLIDKLIGLRVYFTKNNINPFEYMQR